MPKSYNIYFAGTPELAASTLAALLSHGINITKVLTAPDKERGRGRKLLPSPVKALAVEHGIEVYQPDSLRTPEVLAKLSDPTPPDLIIVVAYGLLIPPAILELPKLGCINVHLSLLPRWRGASPITQAIVHGDLESGVTIMQMDQGLDTGAILCSRNYQLQQNETTSSLTASLAKLGSDTLLSALPELLAGKLTSTPQNNDDATYAKKISKNDGLIDWSDQAIAIERKIRGYNPWPVCYTFIDGKRLRVWQAAACDSHNKNHGLSKTRPKPGTITAVINTGIEVQTGCGTLSIEVAQWDNAKQMPIASMLNANNNPLQPGHSFSATNDE